VVRFPSAISGVLAIWATRSIGARLWSAKVGRAAGWMLLTSYGFLFWSRTGTAEAENLAAVIMAVAWYWYRRDRAGFVTFLVFYAIIFLGALTKGLTAVIVPVLAVLPDLMVNRRWRALLAPSHFLALFIAISLYLSPFVYASMTNTASYQMDGLSLVIGVSALTVKLIADKRLALRHFESNEYASVLSCIMVAAIIFGGYFCWQQTILGDWRTERPFVRKLEEKVPGWEPERIASFRRNDPTLHFYLNAAPDMSEEVRSRDSESSRKRKWVAWMLKKPVARQE